MSAPGDPFPAFLEALRARHLPRAAPADVRRGIQALSTLYVEKRDRFAPGATFEGEGKRAAFALFYGPLHFLTLRGILRGLGAGDPPLRRILDLGCGTGVGGAAWALEAGGAAVEAIDGSPWAVEEARWTFGTLGLAGRARRGDAVRARFPGKGSGIIAAWFVNEVGPEERRGLLTGLLRAAGAGARVLVVEPIARPVTSAWWDAWSEAFGRAGGRADEWRFAAELPEDLRELDRLAGLDHAELTARSLWIGGG